jgi:dihydroorotase
MSLLIKNGRVIDPASQTDRICDILIEGDVIKDIAPSIKFGSSIETIDASGLVISPGFIDMHVHLREPGQEHKETIETGSRAAARGGFTSIACMPNTSPINDSVEITRRIIQRVKDVGMVNVFPIAAISINLDSARLTDMEELVKAGAAGFSDDGKCVMNEMLFRKALERAKSLHVPVIEHPEDHSISTDGQMNKGEISLQLGMKGIPSASEDVIIERDIRIQKEVGSYLHLTHISTDGAVRIIENAKKRYIRVTSDVTPHHLLLNETVLINRDTVYKMKPPLRTERDRLALVEGIKNGVIDCIASDHAPHSREEKNREFETAPFGIIGMETSFSVIYDRLVRTGIIDLNRLIRLFSTNPASVLQLKNRGIIKFGAPADLTLLDLDKPFKIRVEDFRSKAINCPFIGWEGKGVVSHTIVGGRIVYRVVTLEADHVPSNVSPVHVPLIEEAFPVST